LAGKYCLKLTKTIFENQRFKNQGDLMKSVIALLSLVSAVAFANEPAKTVEAVKADAKATVEATKESAHAEVKAAKADAHKKVKAAKVEATKKVEAAKEAAKEVTK
jgi:hypothetical protein